MSFIPRIPRETGDLIEESEKPIPRMTYGEHLKKGKAALADAAAMDVELGAHKLPDGYRDRLDIARVQAEMAQAEALERIANALEDGIKW